MASTWGGHLACDVCGLAYSELRTGETFASVKRMMRRGPDSSSWIYKRRHGVLGFWHQLKLMAWNSHVTECWHYTGNGGRAPCYVSVRKTG